MNEPKKRKGANRKTIDSNLQIIVEAMEMKKKHNVTLKKMQKDIIHA